MFAAREREVVQDLPWRPIVFPSLCDSGAGEARHMEHTRETAARRRRLYFPCSRLRRFEATDANGRGAMEKRRGAEDWVTFAWRANPVDEPKGLDPTPPSKLVS